MENLPKGSPIERALRDAAKDRMQADEWLEAANVRELHTLCCRLVDDRKKLGEAFNAVVQGWAMIDNKGPATATPDAIAAVERIAIAAIQLAQDVMQTFRDK